MRLGFVVLQDVALTTRDVEFVRLGFVVLQGVALTTRDVEWRIGLQWSSIEECSEGRWKCRFDFCVFHRSENEKREGTGQRENEREVEGE